MTEEERKRYRLKKQQTEQAVSAWIKNRALYPDSYEPISFSDFAESFTSKSGVKVIGSETYSIKHSHRIFDVDSNPATFTGYFLLENDFEVNIIEEQRSNSFAGAFPPVVEIWTTRFGRSMNHRDSLDLAKKQKTVQEEFVREMKEMVDHDSSGNERIQSLIDTVESWNQQEN